VSVEDDKNISDALKHLENVDNINVIIQKDLDKSQKQIADIIIKNQDSADGSIDSANNIKDDADKIKDNADSIDDKTDGTVSDEVNTIKEDADKIKSEADKIIEYQKIIKGQNLELEATRNRLNNAIGNLGDQRSSFGIIEDKLEASETLNSRLKDQIKSKNEEIKRANSKAEQELRSRLMWMVIVGIVGVALCIASAVNGNAKAWTWAGVGAALVVTCIAVMHFYTQLAWAGLIGGAIVIVLLFFKIKRDLDLKRANEELVQTGEIMKDALPVKKKTELFGHGAVPGAIDNVQSKATKNLVHNVRKNKRDVWGPTVAKS
jgi:cation transport ATPase